MTRLFAIRAIAPIERWHAFRPEDVIEILTPAPEACEENGWDPEEVTAICLRNIGYAFIDEPSQLRHIVVKMSFEETLAQVNAALKATP